ncbi:hypothetical protein HDV02_004101 [Globomyces sp. JEL0801]|nr:hypothetical protein HDV02_004101 [Globomyces sp. JEL0801]
MNKYKNRLEELETAPSPIEEKFIKTQEELIRYRNDANEAENHVKDLTMMNEQLMTKISRMSEQIAQQDDRRMSANPMQFIEAEMNTLKSQLNDSLEKINRLQQEKMELINKLDDLEDHNRALQDNLASLKAQF